ncbi:MAG: response regulator transcription factor [Actinomycetia bacterium]|nr:response regulator transcription factor [Actinomycetes bacterium]
MITVVIIDDDELVVGGLSAIVATQSDMTVVATANTAEEGLQLVGELKPTIVLMDIRMPGTDGLAATRELTSTELDPKPAVLIVTTFGLDAYILEALRAGAAGFILKRSKPEDLLGAIRMAARGDSVVFPSNIGDLMATKTDTAPNQPTAALEQLSNREQQVLKLLARGMNNTEIATELYVGLETVRSHVAGVLRKLNVRDRTSAAVIAYETGFVTPGGQGRPFS